MDLLKVPLGKDADVSISIAKGKVILMVEVSAQEPIDKLLDEVKDKLPEAFKPLVDGAKAAIDSALSAA